MVHIIAEMLEIRKGMVQGIMPSYISLLHYLFAVVQRFVGINLSICMEKMWIIYTVLSLISFNVQLNKEYETFSWAHFNKHSSIYIF